MLYFTLSEGTPVTPSAGTRASSHPRREDLGRRRLPARGRRDRRRADRRHRRRAGPRSRCACGDRSRRRRAAAGPRRLARARQRAGPHRVGGVPLRDARRRGRRCHDHRRHAAELPAADDDRRGARDQARGGGSRRRTSTSGSGAGPCPDNLGALAPLHEAGVFGFKCFLSPSGVDEFPHLDRAAAARRAWRRSRPSARGSSCTPKTRRSSHDNGALGRGYDAFLASRPPASEASAIDAVIDAARRTGARAHILHLSDAHSLPAIRAAKAEGDRAHRRDLSALPDDRRRRHPRRRERVQVLPADPRRRQPGPAVGGGRRRHDRRDRERPLAEHRRPQALRRRRLRPRVGRHRGAAGRTLGGVDRGAGARHPAGENPAALHDRAGRRRRADRCRSHRTGAPAHLTVFGVDDPFLIEAARLLHKNPITAYDHRVLTGKIRRTWLHGRSIYNVTEGGAGEAPRFRGTPRGHLLSAAA